MYVYSLEADPNSSVVPFVTFVFRGQVVLFSNIGLEELKLFLPYDSAMEKVY